MAESNTKSSALVALGSAVVVLALVGLTHWADTWPWTIGRDRADSKPAGEPRNEARVVHALASNLFATGETPSATSPGMQSLASLLQWVSSGEDVDADAVVLIGDLGLGSAPATAPAAPAPPPAAAPGAPAADGAKPPAAPAAPAPPAAGAPAQTPAELQAARAQIVAKIINENARNMPIYVVPGGRKVLATEQAATVLRDVQAGLAAVAKQLSGGATLVDLSRCYVATPADTSGCIARLPGRRVRLIGYPAFSFAAPATAQSTADQQSWTNTFKAAVESEETGTRTVVVASLAPPVADHWSTDAIKAAWPQAASRAAAGIGVSSAPPPTRALYERNEAWTELGVDGTWYLTPALMAPPPETRRSVQGAAVLSVSADGTVDHHVFWYTPKAAAFRGTAFRAVGPKPRGGMAHAVYYLWSLGALSPLGRTSLFAVALLAAFLTVVAVWQIPAPAPLTTPAQAPAQPVAPAQAPPAVPALAQATFLAGNFARTAVSGLGGLAVAMLILDALWTTSKADAQGYYVVWFILFFLLFLVMSSLYRGVLEGFRALTVTAQPPRQVGNTRWIRRHAGRVRWFVLVAGDVIFNVIQGRNEVRSAVLGETIRDLQTAALLAIDRVCENITTVISEFVETKNAPLNLNSGDIRVSVSVLSDDGKRTYYVSKAPQSIGAEFGEKSIAWVVVTSGEARWYIESDPAYPGTLQLFDNTAQPAVFPAPHQASMVLSDYVMKRASDYEAFIVIPIPLRQRGGTDAYRKAGLHISFRHRKHFADVWSALAANPYKDATHVLDNTPQEVQPVLKQAIEVTEAVLKHFNEVLFLNDLRLRRRT